ncbi:3-keto-5-aminohexanoate cleavage protein [Pseudonocardia acaciae]|uniref:3-keto-5-aminohexanoate cleavage protein n=1 Tax=Pseudonocardia acaciae TaxID=551276 RepID=UPI0004915395|nr:3-keto-5-aminohexanoate cleavage protein [Pseudonocardia acaciae]
MIQLCPNGPHRPGSHPALPVTADAVVADVRASLAAGAAQVHVHPKDADGADSLHPRDVDPLVEAIRAACPGIPVGVTTGLWATGSAGARSELVAAWRSRPDYASVNWHEDGAEELADLLLDLGIGVEAGLWFADAARRFAGYPRAASCTRVLVEATDQDVAEAVREAEEMLAVLTPVGPPVLLHGEGANTWPVLDMALARGLDTRIGLEDTFLLPDGRRATDNAELVTVAVARADGDPRSPARA